MVQSKFNMKGNGKKEPFPGVFTNASKPDAQRADCLERKPENNDTGLKLREWTEEEDYGCIEGCMLTDVLHEIMNGLKGEYFHLIRLEKIQEKPDLKRIEQWEKRERELEFIRKYFARPEVRYSEMRKWIAEYGKEEKEAYELRSRYSDPWRKTSTY